ncbi:hypothetical protein MRX96_000155 [Rhipicephalus microplus]
MDVIPKEKTSPPDGHTRKENAMVTCISDCAWLIVQFVVGPRCDFLQNDGVRAARVAPFNPPEPESRRRQANETSMDNADEPAPKRFNAVSESEDDCTCEQDADLVECGEESEGVPLCKHNMTHACLNDVLNFCWRRGIADLPKDARTVLKTERKAQVEQNGSFVHSGLEEGIRQVLRQVQALTCVLKLQGNIDGVPLYKSSQLAFWPILCHITNVQASPLFFVSAYCGAGKPPCLEDYLRPFVQEVTKLTSEGLSIGDIHVHVRIKAMVVDAPTRSYIKCIVGHTGYYACERCIQKGKHVGNRVTFPRLHAPARTDASFHSQEKKKTPSYCCFTFSVT